MPGQEFPLVIECRLLHALELGLHTRFIGEVLDVKKTINALTGHRRCIVVCLSTFLFAACTA